MYKDCTSYVEPRMGKRKLRFFVTKNYERKKYAARVQPQTPLLEGSAIPSQTLNISIPFSAFTAAQVSSVAQLNSLFIASNRLPQTWVNMTVSAPTPSLLLSRLQCKPPLFCSEIHVAYNIQIDQHLRWTLTVFNNRIENDHCSLLAALPSKFQNVDDLVALLQRIDGAKVCVGNPNQGFLSLTEQTGGLLFDQSGWHCCPFVA